jgi:hypothetical protein
MATAQNAENIQNRRPWAIPADQNISNWADWIFKVNGEGTQSPRVVKGPNPPDTRRNLDIPSTIARPLLCILTVHLDFMTVLTYMRGIKITINILMKYLERFL